MREGTETSLHSLAHEQTKKIVECHIKRGLVKDTSRVARNTAKAGSVQERCSVSQIGNTSFSDIKHHEMAKIP